MRGSKHPHPPPHPPPHPLLLLPLLLLLALSPPLTCPSPTLPSLRPQPTDVRTIQPESVPLVPVGPVESAAGVVGSLVFNSALAFGTGHWFPASTALWDQPAVVALPGQSPFTSIKFPSLVQETRIWRYLTRSQAWSPCRPVPVPFVSLLTLPTLGHRAVRYNETKLLVYGGVDERLSDASSGQWQLLGKVLLVDPLRCTVEELAPAPSSPPGPGGRFWPGLALWPEKNALVVAGGCTAMSYTICLTASNDIHAFDLTQRRWYQLLPETPAPATCSQDAPPSSPFSQPCPFFNPLAHISATGTLSALLATRKTGSLDPVTVAQGVSAATTESWEIELDPLWQSATANTSSPSPTSSLWSPLPALALPNSQLLISATARAASAGLAAALLTSGSDQAQATPTPVYSFSERLWKLVPLSSASITDPHLAGYRFPQLVIGLGAPGTDGGAAPPSPPGSSNTTGLIMFSLGAIPTSYRRSILDIQTVFTSQAVGAVPGFEGRLIYEAPASCFANLVESLPEELPGGNCSFSATTQPATLHLGWAMTHPQIPENVDFSFVLSATNQAVLASVRQGLVWSQPAGGGAWSAYPLGPARMLDTFEVTSGGQQTTAYTPVQWTEFCVFVVQHPLFYASPTIIWQICALPGERFETLQVHNSTGFESCNMLGSTMQVLGSRLVAWRGIEIRDACITQFNTSSYASDPSIPVPQPPADAARHLALLELPFTVSYPLFVEGQTSPRVQLTYPDWQILVPPASTDPGPPITSTIFTQGPSSTVVGKRYPDNDVVLVIYTYDVPVGDVHLLDLKAHGWVRPDVATIINPGTSVPSFPIETLAEEEMFDTTTTTPRPSAPTSVPAAPASTDGYSQSAVPLAPSVDSACVRVSESVLGNPHADLPADAPWVVLVAGVDNIFQNFVHWQLVVDLGYLASGSNAGTGQPPSIQWLLLGGMLNNFIQNPTGANIICLVAGRRAVVGLNNPESSTLTCPRGTTSASMPNSLVQPCQLCAVGAYADSAISSSNSACQPCPSGLTTAYQGSIASSDCNRCVDDYCNGHGDCRVVLDGSTGLPEADCRCHFGYSGQHCHSPWLLYAGVGVLAAGLVVLVLYVLFKTRLRKLHVISTQQSSLLTAAQFELAELNRVFDIDARDLQLVKRIDNEAGASGEVWVAHWNGSTVAVKILKEALYQMSPESAEDFEREANALKRLRHRNIVLFYGTGRIDRGHGERPFLLTEYLARGSLRDILLDASVELTVGRRLGFAVQTARGMAFLHGLTPPRIHRDLKSANLLVSSSWQVKVADFGTARLLDQLQDVGGLDAGDSSVAGSASGGGGVSGMGTTSASASSDGVGRRGWLRRMSRSERADALSAPLLGHAEADWAADSAHAESSAGGGVGGDDSHGQDTGLAPTPGLRTLQKQQRHRQLQLTTNIGTPVYAAPEILQRLPYGLKCDIYSYGIVLFEIASRSNPYAEEMLSALELPAAVVDGLRPRWDAEHCGDAPAWLGELARRCWAAQPTDRPDFEQIVEEIEGHIEA